MGKSAIPDAILQKPGSLTEDEMMFIRRHTIIGERILGQHRHFEAGKARALEP